MMFIFLLLCSAASAAKLDQEVVDMTFAFDETIFNYPEVQKFEKNGTHKYKEWYQLEDLIIGTYIDSPSFFDENGKTVDQLLLDHLIAPVAIIDITPSVKLEPDVEGSVEDLLYWEALTGQTLNETILLLKSGWWKKWKNQTTFLDMEENVRTNLHHPGLAPEAAKWLVENRNIYGIGVETPHVDRGSSKSKEAQKILLRHDVFTVQNVANMDKIPIYGATMHVIPMKFAKASRAPVRAFATYPVVLFDYIPAIGTNERF
ncbi:isatin hydrolase-like [Argiope bruennichi]|uniref:Isatin hydrolase like protein n=1 Tax=Argiope bruennichi TaxID=94029 RepID=A0A8T0EQ37_ARGBR|nr:isatin hydrolase-like [Argiope bruennichi]KAF8777847.1 Isatin hydrolase like protein [Argiope bruennichi]